MSAACANRGLQMRPARVGRGFSLVELLLTVTVIGILAAIAIPSYSAYIVRGQRTAAKTALLQAAQFLERNYTVNGCYQYVSPAACQAPAGASPTLPANSPGDGGLYTYAVQVAYPTAQTYTLTALPCGDAGSNCPANVSNQTFADPDCDVLTLTNTGAKTASGALGAICWQR